MNYKQALDYMFSQLPMFHRIGAPAYKANLDNTLELSRLTGFPYNNFRTIHVAGTNGKGSVSHMLASIFQEAGLKTALFTSPHLVDFRERIKVVGKMISQQYVADFVEKYEDDFAKIKPSFFEMTFALAMCYFNDMKVDIAVVETGLGGRLDSTNVITPELSVITNIGFDHMQFLGNTLEDIAGEKAGIIKQNIPVVIGESDNSTDKVFTNKANECNSKLVFADRVVRIEQQTSENHTYLSLIAKSERDEYEIESPLTGDYQVKNIATIVAAFEMLLKNTDGSNDSIPIGNLENLNKESLLAGIKNTIVNTGLQGRWQILSNSPLTICDIGHNTHGITYVVNQLNRQTYTKLHFVLGVVNDKDVSGILSILPVNATYYFCKANIPRGLDSSELKRMANESGLKGQDYETVETAYKAAFADAAINDLIFIGGSAFVVAEILPLFISLSN